MYVRWIVIICLVRGFQLLFYFFPAILVTPLIFIPYVKQLWWRLVKFGMEHAGGCWIKLGQWASTRPDIFDSVAIGHFEKLCSDCPYHSQYYTKR